MTMLTITLTDELARQLKERAVRYDTTLEAIATQGIQELLSRPDPLFDLAKTHILRKNAELYRRLA